MRARALAGGVCVVLLAGACSGRGTGGTERGLRVVSVLSATESADSARFQTVTQSVDSTASKSLTRSTTEGEIDFADKSGSETRTTSGAHSPVLEFRWRSGIGYQRTDVDSGLVYGAPKRARWLSTNGAQIANAGGCAAYLANPTSSLLDGSSSLGTPFDTVLDNLRAAGATLVRLGTDTVRSTPTTHWRVELEHVSTTTAPPNCPQSLSGMKRRSVRVEIWTDARSRLRRAVVVTEYRITNLLGQSFAAVPSSGPSTVVQTTTTEFYDFGVAVHVEVPPADEVFDITAEEAAMLAGPGTAADGDWSDAAHGTFRGVAWTVWYARTDTKWRCYDAEGVPRSPDDLPIPNAAIFPKHDGRVSDCSPPATFPSSNGAFTAILTGVDGDRFVLVGRVDASATGATLQFRGGGSKNLKIDEQTRLVQWSGPASRPPAEVASGGVACALSAGVASDDEECEGVVDPVIGDVSPTPPPVP